MYTDTAYDAAYGAPVRSVKTSDYISASDAAIYDRTYDKRSYATHNDIYGSVGGVNAPVTRDAIHHHQQQQQTLGTNFAPHYAAHHSSGGGYSQPAAGVTGGGVGGGGGGGGLGVQAGQGSTLVHSSHHHSTSQQSPYVNRYNRTNDYKILVNVGGVRHELLWSTLEKFPFTRLGRLQECRTEDAILNYCDHYSYDENEYFFDKNPKIFQAVISCYRTGKLHIPDEFCLTELVTELRYWGFDEHFLDMCCQQKYKNRKLLYQEMKADAEAELWQLYGYGNNNYLNNYPPYNQMFDGRFGVTQCAIYRKFLWDSFENPRSSKRTKVLPTISIIFNTLAVIAVALGSVDSIKEKDKLGHIRDNILISRLTMVCFTWISIEWLMRMYSAPRVSQFIFDICTIIDLLGCVLYFYTVIVSSKNQSLSASAHASSDRLNDAWKMFLMFRSWKIPHMICKLLYDPSVLQLDRAILFNFNKQFGILFLFFITGVVMSSTAIYVAEKDIKDSPFTSIPETFWFAVATLTTSGNSFAYPTSTLGKYFTSLCSLVGVIFIAAVITIANFAKVLQNINQNRMNSQGSVRQPASLLPLPSAVNYGATSHPSQMTSNQQQQQQQHQQHQQHQQQQVHPTSLYSGGANRMTGSAHQPPQAGLAGGFEDANSSYHHITFSDDLANALGTIDVLVERDRKPIREPTSHTSNRVKTITLKIKMDPLGKASGGLLPSGAMYSTGANMGHTTGEGKLGHLHNATSGLSAGNTITVVGGVGTGVSSGIPATSTTLTGVTSRAPVAGQSSFHHSTNASTAVSSGAAVSTANERAYV